MSCPDDKDSGRSQSEYGDLPFLLLEMEKNIVKTSQADGYLAVRIPEPTSLEARLLHARVNNPVAVLPARAPVSKTVFS